MAVSIINSDLRVVGDFQSDTMTIAAASIADAQVTSTANVAYSKLQQFYKVGTNFGHAFGDTPTDEERMVFVASAAAGATIQAFHATLWDTGTTSDVKFDLKVNGSSVLSATVDFTHSDADKTVKDGTISTPSVSLDDIITIECDQTTTTGCTGPYAWVEISENAPT